MYPALQMDSFTAEPPGKPLKMTCARVHAKLLQMCPTLCDPMDSSPSGSSVYGILQARILEWVAISSSSLQLEAALNTFTCREKEEIPPHLCKTYTHSSQKEEKHSCILLLLQTLVIWKESYDQPRQHIEKQRHYFANKGPSSQTMVFPVVMYGCENRTIKKAERRRIDAFELWCWRRLLRVPWTARRYNKSMVKEISAEYSLEGLMLKLKLQYFGYLM